MSLYNMLFGVNPCSGTLLKMLDIPVDAIPRFRDCFVKGNAIVIYTRTGGGNREDYGYQINWLRSRPGFLAEHDSAYDSTFAYFAYSIPPQHVEGVKILRSLDAERDPEVEWPRLLAKLQDPAKRDDPEVKAALEKSKPLMDRIEATFKNGGPPIIEV